MKTLEIVVTVIGILFVLFILCNIKIKTSKERRKEDFDGDLDSCEPNTPGRVSCPITQGEYNNLNNKWKNYVDTKDSDMLKTGYIADLSALSNSIGQQISQCHDDDVRVERDSDGDCPNCDYAKKLFGLMDFDSNKDIGFGPLSNYCPNSLNVPGAQVCLRKLKANASDITELTETHRQFLIDNVKKENNELGTQMDSLKKNVDDKLERDYVKTYLLHHHKFDTAVKDFRKGDLEFEEVVKAQESLPEIKELEEGQTMVNNTSGSDNAIGGQSNQLKEELKPLYGSYLFDVPHTREILINQKDEKLNYEVTENHMSKLFRSTIEFNDNGFYIHYDDGTAPTGITIDNVSKVPNPKSNQIAYKISGGMGTYEIYPDEYYLYVKIISSGYINPMEFLEGKTYLISKK